MTTIALSPEARCLLLTAGGSANDAAIRELVERGLDWSRLTALAEEEKAVPILWRRLQKVSGGRLPAGETERLRRLSMVLNFRAAYLEQRLHASVESLRAAGIEPVLLKGAALGSAVYAEFSQRPMGDLDLLVEPAQAAAARETLLRAGWCERGYIGRETFYEEHHHQKPLTDSADSGVRLEVHTEVLPHGHPFQFSAASVRARSRVSRRAGREVRVPAHYHLLLHSCLHFSWGNAMATGVWRTFRDIAALTDDSSFDWNEFVELAAASNARTLCYWTLRLAAELAGMDVPASVLAALRPPLPERVLSYLERHYAHNLFSDEAVCPSVALHRSLWLVGCQPRQIGRNTTRPWDHEAAPTPAGIAPRPAQGMLESLRKMRAAARYAVTLLAV